MLNWFSELFDKFGEWLITVLPTSPFQGFLGNFREAFTPYLSTLNWFVPIGDFLAIFTVWLSAVALFYLYSIIMRWVKML